MFAFTGYVYSFGSMIAFVLFMDFLGKRMSNIIKIQYNRHYDFGIANETSRMKELLDVTNDQELREMFNSYLAVKRGFFVAMVFFALHLLISQFTRR
jgi:hypothetical protein